MVETIFINLFYIISFGYVLGCAISVLSSDKPTQSLGAAYILAKENSEKKEKLNKRLT